MDMVTMNIIESAMVAICREMGVNVQKTAYSTIFSEAEDFTCALANTEGEMIAVAEFCPAQIGGVPLLVRSMVKEISLAEIHEGDVIVHNDPYRGGLHTPEHTMFKPVFVEGELMGFAVAIGHFVETGGMVPGGFPGEATEIFHEGFRVPPVKIKKRGEDVVEVWKLMLANVRTPRQNYGDIRALISAVDLGEDRLKELIGKYGREAFRQTVTDLMDYSEARMRAEIAAFPDGCYRFEDGLEDDGIEDKEFTIRCAVHVQGDEVVIDYTGSSPQALGPINATLGVAWSASYNAMLHLTDQTIPKNSGCFRPIRIIAPAGSVMNVNYPGSEVGGNTETHPLIVAIILGAMAPAAPDRVMASEGTTHGCFVFGGYDARNDEPIGAFDFSYVGYGGRSFADGNDATDSINGNCANTPTEVFETRFPWIVEEYALRPDSGRGGCAPRGLEHLQDHALHRRGDDQPDDQQAQESRLGPLRRRLRHSGRHALPGGRRQPLDHGRRGLRQDLHQQVLQRADPPRRARLGEGAGRRRLRRAARARSPRRGGGRARGLYQRRGCGAGLWL